MVGQKTSELLKVLGIAEALKGRLDVAMDARGVLDHMLNGQADVGIIFGPDAYDKRERVRVVAVASAQASAQSFILWQWNGTAPIARSVKSS